MLSGQIRWGARRLIGRTKQLLSPSRYLALINVLSSGVGFIQGLVSARHLGPEAYGVIAVIAGTSTTVLNLLDIRLGDLAGKLYYRRLQASAAEMQVYRASVLQICLIGNGLISLTLSVLGFIANLVLIKAFTSAPIRNQWLLAQSLALAVANWSSSFDYLQRFSGRFYMIGTWRLLTRTVTSGVFLGVLLTIGGLDGYYAAALASAGLTLVMASSVSVFIWLKYEHLPLLHKDMLQALPEYWREFRFLFFGNLLGYVKMLHRGSDVLVVGLFADDRVTGLYKLTRSLTDSLYLLFDALNQVYYPHFMKLLSQRLDTEYRRLSGRLFAYSGIFTIAVLIGEVLLLPPLMRLTLANRFAGAESAIMVMTIPFLFVTGAYVWLWPIFVHSGQLERYTAYSFLACFAQYAAALAIFHTFQPSPLAAALGYLAYYCVLFPLVYLLLRGGEYGRFLPSIAIKMSVSRA